MRLRFNKISMAFNKCLNVRVETRNKVIDNLVQMASHRNNISFVPVFTCVLF